MNYTVEVFTDTTGATGTVGKKLYAILHGTTLCRIVSSKSAADKWLIKLNK